MPPVGTAEADRKKNFSRNLHVVLATCEVEPHNFVADFAKFAETRPSTVTAYLAGLRRPYDEGLEKVAEFLRRLVPGLQGADLLDLAATDFETRLKSLRDKPGPSGILLAVPLVEPSMVVIQQLIGSYRLFRFARGKGPKIVSEALSISQEAAPQADGTDKRGRAQLTARLWPAGATDAVVYTGSVVPLEKQINIIMTHVSESGVAMRTLMLRANDKGMLTGIMSGVDETAEIGAADVALQYASKDPEDARTNTALRKSDATSEASKEILLALSARRGG